MLSFAMILVNIYCLKDPITSEVRYIGKTVDQLNERLKVHIHQSKKPNKKTHKECWIRGLIDSGHKPLIELIEVATEVNWVEREKYWIAYYRNICPTLTNATDGGDGSHGYKPSEESRKRRSLLAKGKRYRKHYAPLTQEQKDKLKGRPAWNKGIKGLCKRSEDWKLKHSEKIKGDNHPMVKVSDTDISVARNRFNNGEKATKLAKEYGLTYSHMLKVLKNKSRKI